MYIYIDDGGEGETPAIDCQSEPVGFLPFSVSFPCGHVDILIIASADGSRTTPCINVCVHL